VRAVLSSMAEPLGRAIGNALEVREAIDVLRGGGPGRPAVRSRSRSRVEALEATAASGTTRTTSRRRWTTARVRRFERWVAAQGGDVAALADLEVAPGQAVWRAPRKGVVAAYDAEAIGRAVQRLGGGRTAKDDVLDLGVGLTLHAKVGDPVAAGEPLATCTTATDRGLEAPSPRSRTPCGCATPPHPAPAPGPSAVPDAATP
jgi:thymidine phosphorylase